MKCQEVEKHIINFVDGALPMELTDNIQQHNDNCNSCQNEIRDYKLLINKINNEKNISPPARLSLDFAQMIENEKQSKSKRMIVNNKKWWYSSVWLKIAAAIILFAGGFGVGKITVNNSEKQMVEMHQNINEMKQMMLLTMLNKQSPSERIKAVSLTNEIETPDNDVVNALCNTLLIDQNANVRMATIKALARFHQNEKIRKTLVKALQSEENPMIQIELINLLVTINEHKAVKPMKDIINEKDTEDIVKQIAEEGLSVLM